MAKTSLFFLNDKTGEPLIDGADKFFNMSGFTYCEGHRWLLEWPIAGLDIPAAELAARHSLPTKQWWDPGLGPAVGFGGRLLSGKYVVLYEHLERPPDVPRVGTEVYADPVDVAAAGIPVILDELLASLNLGREAVLWQAGEELQLQAAELVERARQIRPELFLARNSGNAPHSGDPPEPTT